MKLPPSLYLLTRGAEYELMIFMRRVCKANHYLNLARRSPTPGTRQVYLDMARIVGEQARGWLKKYVERKQEDAKYNQV